MDEAIVLQELEALAEELAVELRYDALESNGGLCKFRGKTCLILNRALSVSERIHLLSRELSRFPLDDVFIRPHIRELLEGHNPAQPFDF